MSYSYWDYEQETTINRQRSSTVHYEPLDDANVISAYGSTEVARHSSSPSCGPTKAAATAEETLANHQALLPRLPIPPLRTTCELYLKSIAALANMEEYEATEAAVSELLKPDGVGEQLQSLLEKYNEECGQPSWLEEFWDDAYLCTRDPIPINVNYFFSFDPHRLGGACMAQASRASAYLHAFASSFLHVRDQTLSVDLEGRKVPLCMSQYRRVFCSSRIPLPQRDKILCYNSAQLTEDELRSKTTEYVTGVKPKHCIVMMRNRIYKMEVLTEDGTAVRSAAELESSLRYITELATAPGAMPGPPVGVFTTGHRDAWTEAYQQLLDRGNSETLTLIQSAIVVVCLDTISTNSPCDGARLILHGSGTNRWFDKHNLIVTDDGWTGMNFEHSVGDGATTLRVADYMCNQDAKRTIADAEAQTVKAKEMLSHADNRRAIQSSCEELIWKLDPVLDRSLKVFFDDFLNLMSANETDVLHFGQFGGNYIKGGKLSPDAFVQVAFQLTYFKLFGRHDATYEAASTRAFLHGRTETVRSVTSPVVDFCAHAEPVFRRRPTSQFPDANALLRRAVEAHVEYMQLAKKGYGVDRHLKGLKMMAALHDIPLPAVFTDPMFARSCHWSLSTSHCGSAAFSAFGFGPVVSDGFGLGYIIKANSISVCITSKYTQRRTSSSMFASMLAASLMQMKAIVDSGLEMRTVAEGRAAVFQHPTSLVEFQYDDRRGFLYKAKAKKSLYATASKESLE